MGMYLKLNVFHYGVILMLIGNDGDYPFNVSIPLLWLGLGHGGSLSAFLHASLSAVSTFVIRHSFRFVTYHIIPGLSKMMYICNCIVHVSHNVVFAITVNCLYSCFFCFRALSTQQAGYVRATNLYYGVSWPSGLAYRTQVLVLATECGFESRP